MAVVFGIELLLHLFLVPISLFDVSYDSFPDFLVFGEHAQDDSHALEELQGYFSAPGSVDFIREYEVEMAVSAVVDLHNSIVRLKLASLPQNAFTVENPFFGENAFVVHTVVRLNRCVCSLHLLGWLWLLLVFLEMCHVFVITFGANLRLSLAEVFAFVRRKLVLLHLFHLVELVHDALRHHIPWPDEIPLPSAGLLVDGFRHEGPPLVGDNVAIPETFE